MALAWLDDTGLHLPDYPAVLEDLQARVRGVYGDDLYLGDDSPDGQLVAIFARAVFDAYSLAGQVYNSFAPGTAQGAALSRMVPINGIRRDKAGRSTADVRCIGQAGTVIRNGRARDVQGGIWLLPAEVVIPLEGEITVTASAEDEGEIRAGAGEINIIATPCRGWQSVGNPAAAVPGAAVESDARLRARQAVSTALPSLSVFDGTLGAVAAVSGVTRSRGYENDTGAPDDNGIPAHSICLVVEGGNASAIAEAIARKKTPGTGTYGDIAVSVPDAKGVPNVIRFYRPTDKRITARITIKPLAGYLSTTGEAARTAFAEAVNTLGIGEDVLLSRLYPPLIRADLEGQRTFDVVDILLGEGEGDMAVANITIPFNGVAVCDVADVELAVAVGESSSRTDSDSSDAVQA